MLQSVSPTQLDQPGLPFTIDDRLAIRAASVTRAFSGFEVSVTMNHPAYFEVAEVFIRGHRDVAFIIWRSPIGMMLENLVCNLEAFDTGLTMGEIFEWLTKLARLYDLPDGSDGTNDQRSEPLHRPH